MENRLDEKHKIPTNDLLEENPFAELYMGWNEDAVAILVKTSEPINLIEFFFDTRDLKAKKLTKFCQRFQFSKMQEPFFFPALVGYDPDQFSRLGFTYRITAGSKRQHFSASSEIGFEHDSSFWATVYLVDLFRNLL